MGRPYGRGRLPELRSGRAQGARCARPPPLLLRLLGKWTGNVLSTKVEVNDRRSRPYEITSHNLKSRTDRMEGRDLLGLAISGLPIRIGTNRLPKPPINQNPREFKLWWTISSTDYYSVYKDLTRMLYVQSLRYPSPIRIGTRLTCDYPLNNTKDCKGYSAYLAFRSVSHIVE